MGCVQRHASAALSPREIDTATIVQEAGWAPRQVWTDAENLAPNGIRSPNRPSRSKPMYRLSYSGQQKERWFNHSVREPKKLIPKDINPKFGRRQEQRQVKTSAQKFVTLIIAQTF